MKTEATYRVSDVILAEPHELIRRGLHQILVDGIDGCAVHEVRDARELFRELSGRGSDLLIIDLPLPGASWSDLCGGLRQANGAAVPLIVMTEDPGPEFTRSALRAGAHAVVLKDHADEELLRAIGEVLKGQVYLSPALLNYEGGAVTARGETPSSSVVSEGESQGASRSFRSGRGSGGAGTGHLSFNGPHA